MRRSKEFQILSFRTRLSLSRVEHPLKNVSEKVRKMEDFSSAITETDCLTRNDDNHSKDIYIPYMIPSQIPI